MAARTVQVGEEAFRLEPFSGRKAIRVIRTIERITKGVPEILDEWGAFTRRYEASNVTEMDRATARSQFSPQPLMDEDPIIHEGEALTDQFGNVLVKRTAKLDSTGRPVLGPDPLGHMTEADWEASGHKLRLPRSPRLEEKVAAIFPKALDLAEHETLQLLALLAMSNADLKRASRDGTLDDQKHKATDGPLPESKWGQLRQRADELLDAPAEDLLELAVAAGEMVEEQFVAKVKALGERLPNALRLFGMTPKSQTDSTPSVSETRPTSSTDSPTPTDGESAPSSTEPVGVSSSPSPTG